MKEGATILAELEKSTVENREITYFQEMVLGSEKLIRPWKTAVLGLIIGWVLTIGGFIFYLNQYDFTATTSYEAAGVYALIDSEGNMIAQDVTPETWDKFTEWWNVYGESKSNANEIPN